LFSAIRGGVSLKKVKALPDVTNLSAEEEVIHPRLLSFVLVSKGDN